MAEGGIHQSFLKKFEKEHLHCPICLDLYKQPQTLKCLHSFCRECLVLLGKTRRKKIVCPICRKETHIPVGGIGSLPSDFKLESMIETVLQEEKQPIKIPASHEAGQLRPVCSSHAGSESVAFCVTCCNLVCVKCLMESSAHSKHRVQEVSDVVADKKRSVQEHVLPESEKSLEEIKEALIIASEVRQNFETELRRIEKEIEDEANQEIARVKDAKRCLMGEIRQIQTKREELFRKYTEDLTSLQEARQRLINLFKDALAIHSDYNFLKLYSELNTGLKYLKDQIPRIDPEVSRVTFKATAAGVLTRLGVISAAEWKVVTVTEPGCNDDNAEEKDKIFSGMWEEEVD